MSDRIAYLALVTSIVGLIILTYASENINPPRASVSSLTQADLGRSVHVAGVARSVHVFSGGSAVFTLEDGNASVSVYLPYSVTEKLDPESLEGVGVDLVGVVSVYRGRLEVVVEDSGKIRRLP